MKKYISIKDKKLKEEISPGFIKQYDEKYFVFRIENFKELQNLKGNPRGVIAKNNLYICNDKGFDILHIDILKFLRRQNIVKRVLPEWYESLFCLDEFLCVKYDKKEKVIKLAEGYKYGTGLFRTVKMEEIKKYFNNPEKTTSVDYRDTIIYLKKHLNTLKKLRIPFKLEVS